MEIPPVDVEALTRKGRRERSEALWRLLQGIFGRSADHDGPALRIVGTTNPQGCH